MEMDQMVLPPAELVVLILVVVVVLLDIQLAVLVVQE
jgi:hypothetical protein